MKAINAMVLSVSFLPMLLIGFSSIAAGADTSAPVAIKGYDTVAYFTASRAIKGSEALTVSYHGMTWYFSTKEHRDLFAKSPEKYAPQYDGYCAWALTENRKAITDPEVWKIVDNKLYLNCSPAAYEKWIKDIPGHIKKADENWLKMQK
jgi:YHS domain-containing protein